jgi:hypothetical protein
MSRAINLRPPASSTIFINPKNKVIYPIRPMAKSTLPFAESKAAFPTSAGVPLIIAKRKDRAIIPKKT